MLKETIIPNRHAAEFDTLQQAVDGDAQSVALVLQYLSSSNRYLRGIMLECLHDFARAQDTSGAPLPAAARLWGNLLHCLALNSWSDGPDCTRLSTPTSFQQIRKSIVDAYLVDESEAETKLKEQVLREMLKSAEIQVQFASAYILGMRGDHSVIPRLGDMVEIGEREWQVLAIQALGEIKDPQSSHPILRALAKDRSILHEEAKRSLYKQGRFAEQALLESLNHPDSHIRWHVARALGEIGNPEGEQLLVDSLLDDDADVRWAAADALARLDAAVVPAILNQIIRVELTEPYRQVVYHALHAMISRQTKIRLQPVLNALRSPVARLEAPAAAQKVLVTWTKVSY